MTKINICRYGISVNFWKHEVHGFYTKNKEQKRFIRELRICIGELVTPRFTFTKRWSPLYKTTVSWDNPHAEVWDLIILLEQTKDIKFKIDNKTTNYIQVFHRLPDNIRSTLFRTIENMTYNNSGYGSSYDEESESYKNFTTETVVEKW